MYLIPFCIAEQNIYIIIIMEGMKSEIRSMIQGIQRYNPENIKTLEYDVDLEANPTYDNLSVVMQILLKALINLSHTDLKQIISMVSN